VRGTDSASAIARITALRSLTLAALLPLVPLLAGCPGRTNVFQGTQHLTLEPTAAGNFWGYTFTNFSESIDASKKVHLLDLSVSSSSGEFSWASSVTGAASPDMSEIIVTKSSFAGVGGSTAFDIVDTGDLRPLFPQDNSFRLYWTVDFAPTLAQSYPEGVVLTLNYTIEID
jgi:hypothetical protein